MATKVMFLDESGNHDLAASDSQYPVFVLGGVIVDHDYAAGELEERVRDFKRRLFGREDLILHTADIARNRNGFERMQERAFRVRFYAELNALMRDLEYQVVACAIRKGDHAARYGDAALDPYLLSLNVLVERFCFEIGDIEDGGLIVAEKRSPVLDHELELAWLNLRIRGTYYLRGRKLERRVEDLRLRDKKRNIAGMQLADLVVSPIGRFVLGKPTKEDWTIVEGKFRRRSGSYLGAGLVVLPK